MLLAGTAKKRKKHKGRDKSKSRRKRSRSSSSSGGAYSDSCSSGSSVVSEARSSGLAPHLRLRSTRAGRMTLAGIHEMQKFLPRRGLGGNSQGSDGIISTYMVSVLMPSIKGDLRRGSERELRTLAEALDMLILGYLPEGMDILMRRFQASETSVLDEWSAAQHLELIPPSHVSSVAAKTRDQAISREARDVRTRQTLVKQGKH